MASLPCDRLARQHVHHSSFQTTQHNKAPQIGDSEPRSDHPQSKQRATRHLYGAPTHHSNTLLHATHPYISFYVHMGSFHRDKGWGREDIPIYASVFFSDCSFPAMDIYLFRFSLLFFPHLLDNPPVCSVLNCVPFSQLQTTTRYPNTSPCVSLSLSSTSLRTSTQLECEHDVTQWRNSRGHDRGDL